MKLRFWGIIGTCFFALVTTLSSASVGPDNRLGDSRNTTLNKFRS